MAGQRVGLAWACEFSCSSGARREIPVPLKECDPPGPYDLGPRARDWGIVIKRTRSRRGRSDRAGLGGRDGDFIIRSDQKKGREEPIGKKSGFLRIKETEEERRGAGRESAPDTRLKDRLYGMAP